MTLHPRGTGSAQLRLSADETAHDGMLGPHRRTGPGVPEIGRDEVGVRIRSMADGS